jgi:hypothetical protein
MWTVEWDFITTLLQTPTVQWDFFALSLPLSQAVAVTIMHVVLHNTCDTYMLWMQRWIHVMDANAYMLRIHEMMLHTCHT